LRQNTPAAMGGRVKRKRSRSSGLEPLKEIVGDPRRITEARAESRVARVWPLIVGPALVRHTKLIRIRQQTLVMGCWQTDVMASLRQSAEVTWPQVQARLERLLRLKLQRVEIVPCDPPEPQREKPAIPDSFESVLRKYRSLRNQGWTPKRK
jgi:hypothetical protein